MSDQQPQIQPGSNGAFAQNALQIHYALKQPKAHIPIGLLAFGVSAALSAVPIVPFLASGLVAYDAVRRLRKNRKLVTDANADPTKLFEGLKPEQQSAVTMFLSAYPVDAPLGTPRQKKNLPRPQKTEGAGKSQQTQSQSQSEVSEPKLSSGTKIEDAGLNAEGWVPQDLPAPFVEYLASQIHILIAATTGSGKTWLLRCLCIYLSNQGHRLVIADPKGSQWGELSPAVLRMKSGSDYTALLKDLHRELETRMELLQQGQPVGDHLWAVFDEWMLFKGKAAVLDPAGRAAIEQRLLDIIAAGRELNMHLIMVNQSHILGDLSLSGGKNTFSSGLRDNLCTLGLGCKTTKDNAGNPMQGNSKSIDNMLRDQYLVSDAGDRSDAAAYHAGLRRGSANRTFCLYASQLFIGQTPDLTIPRLEQIKPFPNLKKADPELHGDAWTDG